MEIQTLINLLKVGALGGSLAFLILSFWLLRATLSFKDGAGNPVAPSKSALVATFAFMIFSFVFLITGIVAEVFLANSSAIIGRLFPNDDEVSRVRFYSWDYFPENNKITFGFLEEPRNTSYYVPAKKKQDFDVYVGIRRRDASPYLEGTFPILIGAYGIEFRPEIEKILDSQELAQLGNDCIDLVLFGIERRNGKSIEVNRPFIPNKTTGSPLVFNWAIVCKH